MLRIGLVTQSYHPVRGGVGEHVHHLALALLRRGHQVTVLTGRVPDTDSWSERDALRHPPVAEGAKELIQAGGRIERVGTTRTLSFNGASVSVVVEPGLGFGLARLDRRAFDLIHVHSPFEPLLPIAAMTYFDATKVATFHSAGRHPWGYVPFLPVLAPVAARLAARIAVSRTAREHVRRFFPGEYHLVPNGVDLRGFRRSAAVGSSDASAESPSSPIRILALGRLDPRKGHGVLLDALSLLAERGDVPSWELRIVGSGPLESKLREHAAVSRLPVRFLGTVDDAQRRDEYECADLFVAPATHGESFGIVLLEALAAGLPVLASSIPGYVDVLSPSNAGRVVAPGDAAAWARALGDLLVDATARRVLGEKGAEYAEQYSWTRIADQVENVYQLALAREGRRVRSAHSTVQVVPERSRA